MARKPYNPNAWMQSRYQPPARDSDRAIAGAKLELSNRRSLVGLLASELAHRHRLSLTTADHLLTVESARRAARD